MKIDVNKVLETHFVLEVGTFLNRYANLTGDQSLLTQRGVDRHPRVAAAQVLMSLHGFEPGHIDGWYGHLTEAALEDWSDWVETGHRDLVERSDELEGSPVGAGGPFGSAADMGRLFGLPGTARCTSFKVEVPFDMFLSWDMDSRKRTVSCHEVVGPSLQGIFNDIGEKFSYAERRDLGLDRYGGCYNYRKKRRGTTLSTHAWGVALDWDPERNALAARSPDARLSHADAEPFWAIWEAAGWTSLGRAKNFDWMHVQAPSL